MGSKSKEFYLNKLRLFLEGSTIQPMDDYVDRKTHIRFYCSLCDSTFKINIGSIYSDGGHCRCCDGRSQNTKTIQNKLDALGKNITILGEYVNAVTHMDCQCNRCYYEWSSTLCNLRANGCPSCNKKARRTHEEFKTKIESSKNIKVIGEFVNTKTPVECACTVCNLIWQPHPKTLLRGGGCPACAKSGFDPNKPGMLYYLRVVHDGETYWKIGITNNSIEKRFHSVQDRSKITPLYSYVFENGSIAKQAEKTILSIFSEYRAKNIKALKLCGNTELFTKDVLQMDHLANGGLDNWL